ncbi:unnamed protein product [Closterium sp. Naga37s-1]|nr:unnamed protein product [Closterium sp. Naga37s-1]
MPPLLPGAPQQFPPASPQQYSPAPPQFPPASPQQFAPPSPQFPPGSAQQFPPASPHQFPPASPQFPQGSAQQFPPQQFPPQQFPPQQMFGMGFARGPPGQFSPSPNFSPPTMSAQNVPPGLGAQAMSPLMGPPSGVSEWEAAGDGGAAESAAAGADEGPGAGNAGMGGGGAGGGGGGSAAGGGGGANQRRGQQARAGQQPTEESTQRTVYVSDIDHQVTEEQLATLFLSCGQVVDCRICGDPNSVLRFAFVEFTDEEGAKNALSIAGTMLGYYPLRVLPSKTAILPVNPTYLPKSQEEREMCARTVYCTNIDKKVTQADVKLFFESLCGEISRLRLLGDYHHSTRIAFVEFVMAESAMAALNCSGAILGSLPIRSVSHLSSPLCTVPHLSSPLFLSQAVSAMAALNCSGAILGSLPIRSVPKLPAPLRTSLHHSALPCTTPHFPAPLCTTLHFPATPAVPFGSTLTPSPHVVPVPLFPVPQPSPPSEPLCAHERPGSMGGGSDWGRGGEAWGEVVTGGGGCLGGGSKWGRGSMGKVATGAGAA